MAWLIQHSPNIADIGFGVLIIALALILLRPVEAKKKRNNGLIIGGIGIIALVAAYLFPYLTLSGRELLRTTGVALIIAACFELIQWRIDSGKGKWRVVNIGVLVACVIGALLILLSLIFSNLH